MKTLTIFLIFICTTFCTINTPNAQQNKTSDNTFRLERSEQVVKNFEAIQNSRHLNFPPVEFQSGLFQFIPMGIYSYYDLQSNAVPNQIWQDPLTPNNIHVVYMYSQDTGFTHRTCAYFFSDDMGFTWTFLGDVPSSGRSGFPSISGFENGAAVIANNNNTNGTTTRAKINFDAGPGFGVFTEIDPGGSPAGLWPRIVGIENDKIAIVTSSYSNTVSSGVFSGYVPYESNSAESYWISKAENGRLGHAYIGASNGVNDNDVFYRYSDDDGLTWSNPLRIWDWNVNTDSLGCLRGVSMVFINNKPFVAFNISKLTITGFFPELPSSIRVWSPEINGGIPVIVADDNNVSFYPNKGNTTDAFLPICRPAIGRTMSNLIFMAFPATTGFYGADSSSYYGLWYTLSGNGGVSWEPPRMFTPTTPLFDWRYVSVSQVNHSSNSSLTIQMLAQIDSVPGSYVNGSPKGRAQAISIKYGFIIGITNISNTIPDKFSLAQNFPNPFNPETKIRFDIKENSKVSLKVYDMKGALVSVLADNVNVTPGTKEVSFTANGLSSGVYFYTLTADNFSETKKMILVR